jgi:hypothetical protein
VNIEVAGLYSLHSRVASRGRGKSRERRGVSSGRYNVASPGSSSHCCGANSPAKYRTCVQQPPPIACNNAQKTGSDLMIYIAFCVSKYKNNDSYLANKHHIKTSHHIKTYTSHQDMHFTPIQQQLTRGSRASAGQWPCPRPTCPLGESCTPGSSAPPPCQSCSRGYLPTQ